MNELSLIDYFKKAAHRKKTAAFAPCIRCGIGDDAAVIEAGRGQYFVWTCDMLLEGRHFTKTDALVQVGWKAIACSVSDVAAMGARPFGALISLGLPKTWNFDRVRLLCRGMERAAKKFSVRIIGGDTNASGSLVIDVSMLGSCPRENLILRSGAKEGDYIFVTGALGGSFYGRHLRFMPRLREMQALQKKVKINAMIDISDGLTLDLWRMMKASKTGAVLFRECIPVHQEARSFAEALSMGEDFELLFTAGKKQAMLLLDLIARRKLGFAVSFIGKVTGEKEKMYMLDSSTGKIQKLKPRGFQHF